MSALALHRLYEHGFNVLWQEVSGGDWGKIAGAGSIVSY